MKNILIYLSIAIVLFSCNHEKKLFDYSQKKADKFIENYATEFLSDSELLNYSYHPRGFFMFDKEYNSYSVVIRENGVNLRCSSDSCILFDSFNKNPLVLQKGDYILKQDSLITEISHNQKTFKLHSFELNPNNFFHELKIRLDTYGVFGFTESKNKSFIKVYFSSQYYLIHSKDAQKDIDKDELIKAYGDDWYFVKMSIPMDLG